MEIPLLMVKCCEAIEKHGIQSQGIYRVSGMKSKVAGLKAKLDKGGHEFPLPAWKLFRLVTTTDMEFVDLDAAEWANDISSVSSVMKMWLRELPIPLLTYSLHQGFVEAASASSISSSSARNTQHCFYRN